MMDWQPIETAPKDGKAIIVAAKAVSTEPLTTMFAYWNHRLSWWHRFATSELTPIYPTHWMPLPKPPVAQRSMTLWLVIEDTYGAHEHDHVFSIWTTIDGARAERRRLIEARGTAWSEDSNPKDHIYVVPVAADQSYEDGIDSMFDGAETEPPKP